MQDLVTPEAVALDLEPATVGSRSVAIALDLLLIGSGLLLLGLAEAAFGFGGFVPAWFGIALVLLLVFALQFGYPIGFETLWRGRTPGKAAMGLRVVTVEGAPVRFRHAAVRAAVGLFELTGTLGAVAVIASLASPRGQRLGDLAGGTLVIRERRSASGPQALRFAAPPGLEGYVRVLDVSRLDRDDHTTIRELLRRPLPVEQRRRLAEQVARGLLDRVGPPPPAGVDAETWLRCVAAAVQARAGGLPTSATSRPHATPAAPSGHGAAVGHGPPTAGRADAAPTRDAGGDEQDQAAGPPAPPSAANRRHVPPPGADTAPPDADRGTGFAPPS